MFNKDEKKKKGKKATRKGRLEGNKEGSRPKRRTLSHAQSHDLPNLSHPIFPISGRYLFPHPRGPSPINTLTPFC